MAEKLDYHNLSDEIQKRILEDRDRGWVNPYRTPDSAAVRRDPSHDSPNLWRPAFVRDIEKILHLPYYNRYTDKTQVFSFYNNDDLTRRGLHVQLVSRIARNIGAVLGLNLDLIEAIALGHDIGHTPFGHAGERYLSELTVAETGRAFNHNVQSVRVLDSIFARNLTLQTLDGILCHNGEFEMQQYRPRRNKDFESFDAEVEACYTDSEAIGRLVPCTLEGCVVRICDMIAYIGKDRQDARTAHLIPDNYKFANERIGSENAAIINNLTVDIIENSYGHDYIRLSPWAYDDLRTAKRENYDVIYKNEGINREYECMIRPMFHEMYYKLLDDLRRRNTNSIIYSYYLKSVSDSTRYYRPTSYADTEPNQIVADFIASMTDDYFLALHGKLFPHSPYHIEFKSYFED